MSHQVPFAILGRYIWTRKRRRKWLRRWLKNNPEQWTPFMGSLNR